jgi:hypothetical protein
LHAGFMCNAAARPRHSGENHEERRRARMGPVYSL